jgi:hypothetical protein
MDIEVLTVGQSANTYEDGFRECAEVTGKISFMFVLSKCTQSLVCTSSSLKQPLSHPKTDKSTKHTTKHTVTLTFS